MENSKQKISKPTGMIISALLLAGIMFSLWGVLHLLFPLEKSEIFGLIAFTIVMVVSRTIFNWIVGNTLLIHAMLLICIFWALAWVLYVQIQTAQ